MFLPIWFCWSCCFNSVTIYYRHISLRRFLHLFQILWAAWKDSFPCAHSGRLPPTIKVGCTRINAKRCILPKLPKAFLSPFFSVFNNINFVFLGLSQCLNGSINWLEDLKTHKSLILLSVSTFKDINVVTVKYKDMLTMKFLALSWVFGLITENSISVGRWEGCSDWRVIFHFYGAGEKILRPLKRSFYGRLGSYLDHAYQTDQQSSWVIGLGISAEVLSWDGHFWIKSIPCHFLLDAIASPSTYPCQWVSQSVSDSLFQI